jgi:hypothetical protein
MIQDHHRGIKYSIHQTAPGRWKWEIHPPRAVKGLQPQGGELTGSRDEAVIVARREIELQDLRNLNS